MTLYDENKFRKYDFLGKVLNWLYSKFRVNIRAIIVDTDPSYKDSQWREKVVQVERKKSSENGQRK